MSVVYRKGVKLDGSAPLLLYGYGSYGLSIPPTFSSSRLSLLDRGVIFAIGHIRGGGELGEEWRQAGRMMKKMNTFTDFIACAEALVKQKYTSKDRLVIQGRRGQQYAARFVQGSGFASAFCRCAQHDARCEFASDDE
jgi:oligopeptidase B